MGDEEKSWLARMMERRDIPPGVKMAVVVLAIAVGIAVGLLMR
ncbi:MAG: hypothetical protein OWS03_01670 [Alicyclobacillaceae bacterium]|nr:hypothetical protein [Alicyclobacillaceae bacterium]